MSNPMAKLSKSEPSICIPRVFANVSWKQVKDTIEELLGKTCVERVDLVSKTTEDGAPFGRVFIHFRYWPQTEQAQAIRQQLLSGGFVKIVYDEPWYWKCSMSRVAKPNRERPKQAPYVEFDRPAAAAPPAEADPPASPVSSTPAVLSQEDFPALGGDPEDDALSAGETVAE
jgi:hypothetical protein